MRRPAPSTSVTIARTRKGSDIPIRVVGGSRARRCSSPACQDGDGRWTAQRVEPVVVEVGARGAEGGDAELERGERGQGPAPVEARREAPAQVAADPEAGHERGHDHGHGVEPHPAVERQEALPGDLVDEGGGAAQEEEEAGESDRRRVAPHEWSPWLPMQNGQG